MSRLSAALKKDSKVIQSEGAVLLTMLRSAALRMFSDLDFEGFSTTMLLMDIIRRCFANGHEKAMKDFTKKFDERLENERAHQVKLVEILDHHGLMQELNV